MLAEEAAVARVVIVLGATPRNSPAPPPPRLRGEQHPERRGHEVDPEGVPAHRRNRRAESAGRIHAHARDRRFERDVDGDRSPAASPVNRAARGLAETVSTTSISKNEMPSSAANAQPAPHGPGSVTA